MTGWMAPARSVIEVGGPVFRFVRICLDLSWKRQQRVESGPVQIAPDQLKLSEDVERRSDPTSTAVVGSDLVSSAGLFLEQDDRGALVRSLRDDFDVATAAESPEASRRPFADKAGQAGQALGPA